MPENPRCSGGGYTRCGRSWPVTKCSSQIGAFRWCSSRALGSRGMSVAAPPTLRPGVPRCLPTVARAAARSRGPWSDRYRGRWGGCPCGPSRCSERPGSSSSPLRVGNASPKWRCWLEHPGVHCRHPPRPCPPAFGIGRPARRLVGYDAHWRRCIAKTCRNCPRNFAKNRHTPHTYPQASADIVDRKTQRLYTMTDHSPRDLSCYRKVECHGNTEYCALTHTTSCANVVWLD
jgi:hypothetical protein